MMEGFVVDRMIGAQGVHLGEVGEALKVPQILEEVVMGLFT